MNRRIATVLVFVATGVIACQPGRTITSLVPNLFVITVLPPPGGGTHTIEPGGSLAIEVELVMGVNVSGQDIFVTLDPAGLPPGVTLAFDQLSFNDIGSLSAGERETFTFNVVAAATAPPGTSEVVIEAGGTIIGEGFSSDEGVTDTQSATFSLIVSDVGTNTAPTVTISSPADGTAFAQGATVTFLGEGTDDEDGGLAASALVWSSDIDGVLGSGLELEVTGLSAGNHTITLTGTDSEGATATASIMIVVETGSYPCSAFTFTVMPDELSIPIGGSTSTNITLYRGPTFEGPVTWSLVANDGSDLSSLFETILFDPSPTNPDVTTLMLTPREDASAGVSLELLVTGVSDMPAETCTQPLVVTFVLG